MNRILTGLVIVVAIFLVAFLICGLVGPKECHIQRSVEINAPKALVFNDISDYNHWKNWSPWRDLDSACRYEFFGTPGQVGAGYKWSGNDKIGTGEMKTLEINPGSSLVSQVTFIKPWPGVSKATFRLDDGANGATKVTWAFDQAFSFSQRPMMLLMNLEKMIGPDYERGLANLKSVCETEAASSPAQPALQVQETEWTGKTFVTYRSVVDMKDLGQFFQDRMPKLFVYAKTSKFDVAHAPPCGLYYTWDSATGKSDLAVAIEVKDATKASGEYKGVTLDKSKALLVDYYGPYEKTGLAHDAIGKYIKDKGLKAKSPVIEQYVGDPGVEKDPNKVLTKVYYLIE